MADCLFVYSELFLVLVCDIETGDKNYQISIVSKFVIS